jgi:hypothetical protein
MNTQNNKRGRPLGSLGKKPICSICGSSNHRKPNHSSNPNLRKCSCCKQELPFNNFYTVKRKNNKIIYMSYCKKCGLSKSRKQYTTSWRRRMTIMFYDAKCNSK